MTKSVLIWLILISIVLFSLPLVSSYEIIGDTVLQEDNKSKLEVWPHTARNPVGPQTQNFRLTNKTGSIQNVYVAYKFDTALESGKLEYYIPPVLEWVEHSKQCLWPNEYDVNLNVDETRRNPHRVRCYSGETTLWDRDFKSFNQDTNTIYYDLYEKTGGDYYVNKTSNIEKATKNGKQIYYYNQTVPIAAGESIEWKITYRSPESSGKWELAYYTGENQNCILNDTCTYVQWLDPWFDTDFTWKRAITVGATNTNVIQVDINSGTMSGGFGNLFDASVNSGFSVAFTNSTEAVQLPHDLIYWTADTNAGFRVNLSSESTGTIYMYYGNDSNSSNMATPNTVYTVFDDFADGDYTTGFQTWTVLDGTWSVVGEKLQWDSGANRDVIYTDIGSSTSYAGGLLNEGSFASACEGCSLGINNETDPGAGSADGYDFDADRSTPVIHIQKYENAVNSFLRTINQIVDDETLTLVRNSSADFRLYMANDPLPLAASTNDNTTTAGRYVYFKHGNDATPASDKLDFVKFSTDFNVDATKVFGSEEEQSAANFITSGSQALDPEKGIASTTLTFTNASNPIDANFTWFVDDVNKGNDVNYSQVFTVVGDYNVFLAMDSAGELFSDQETITISTVVQSVDINFSYNNFTVNQVDVNFGVTFDGNGTAFNWGFPSDSNILTRNAQKTYTSSGSKEVCVTITTTDANKSICENFYVGRVIVKIPLDITTLDELSPFDLETTVFPVQSYTGLTVDSNIFVFNDSTNFDSTIQVDFNSDYFSTSRIFTFNSFLFNYQPYLVPVTGNLATIIFTINNINQKQTIPDIKIVSETVIGGNLIIAESKESDITGTAEFHFEIGRTYTLSFFNPDGNLIFSGELDAKSVDTELFAALATGIIFTAPEAGGIINVIWTPTVASVQPATDGNITLTQSFTPYNTVIGDVNIFVTHITDTNVVFNQIFTLDSSDPSQNITFDINVSGWDDTQLLEINLQIFDTNGFQIGVIQSKKYSFQTTQVPGAFESLREELGDFTVMILSIIMACSLLGLITLFSPTTDNNWVGVIAVILTGFFVLVTWIPIEAWLVAASMTIGMSLWRDREQ